ncbi:MAG: hypothetical protein Alis3KO_37120 [Aliiglaciecola sp.]|uniref:hypothetical protein n=1 Tax=Aliiglaciecola sp. M165 TaxID=2593649 RepID=UPI00117DF0F1|nr:hypothetical protein [Aliiglaciecola sp. M165]TRY31056.1 hypothetical protein FM019_14385 [Aliiglaciecola sp. M165]
MTDQSNWQGENRRKTPRSHDRFYQIVLGLNIFAWVVFVAALIVFHYARPELISGVQEYWGVEGRQDWSRSLSVYLLILLALCTLMSLLVLILRRFRTRRQNDYFGINVVILLAISITVLIWIVSDMPQPPS